MGVFLVTWLVFIHVIDPWMKDVQVLSIISLMLHLSLSLLCHSPGPSASGPGPSATTTTTTTARMSTTFHQPTHNALSALWVQRYIALCYNPPSWHASAPETHKVHYTCISSVHVIQQLCACTHERRVSSRYIWCAVCITCTTPCCLMVWPPSRTCIWQRYHLDICFML